MKIAIVTGGSNGIGKATALELGKRGIGVIITYNNYRDRAEQVVEEIEKNGKGIRAVALKLDLAQNKSFDVFADEVRKNLEAEDVRLFDQ
jgi:NAD(P)-dependent dehydrogenase (short-subunit alcohol dehydrogenase family)